MLPLHKPPRVTLLSCAGAQSGRDRRAGQDGRLGRDQLPAHHRDHPPLPPHHGDRLRALQDGTPPLIGPQARYHAAMTPPPPK
eukprot:3412484-Rhodomonas_salina.1